MVSPIQPLQRTPPSPSSTQASWPKDWPACTGTVNLVCYCVCRRGKATRECRLLRGPSGKAVGQFSQLLGERAAARPGQWNLARWSHFKTMRAACYGWKLEAGCSGDAEGWAFICSVYHQLQYLEICFGSATYSCGNLGFLQVFHL